ncbi:glycogen debranching protein GlgX [Cellulomonas fimi]|uniref:Glycogen debranching protein GlgX n=1 Tax=Cellulomonas fimi TaxID=1708 RepID=A0A7Y0M0X4_CELFI|nr:glycogen debranching protein GlgX [Cellulomonas fimi]NMR21534.1 glycogen debranching protein GlgX [Cellulomonas fimi]
MSRNPSFAAARPAPPLGVHLTADGADVAVLASHATGVDLCLIDPDPTSATGWRERRVALGGPTYGVWHAHVPGVRAGQRYGFRAHGAWDPALGLRHNPAKLLVDPYARGVVGELTYGHQTHGHRLTPGARSDPYGPADDHDSLAHVPHSVAVDPTYHGEPVAHPQIPWRDTVVYEAHVRGLTHELPGVPAELRGTYAGLAHPATVDHLRSLGVTALELLPIHAFTSEPHLIDKGLVNYWGYNTLGFFAPHAAYATRAAQEQGASAVLAEVKGAVQLLHEAGIEVLLDVVYNHTCEGGDAGQHVSFRGLDNTVYYLHDGASPARLADVTGCGNSLDFRRPRVVQLALDSLRYWAHEVGVDGFRFDLAVTLGRGGGGFDPDHPFLVALQTDPALHGLKLIAEPWDLGPGGWRTGAFPPPFAEWNDRYRNAVRTFWLADPGHASHGRPGNGVAELATRLAGSVDLFGHTDPPFMRGPVASVNYVTAHDGFTMADLVTYEHKHNAANGEQGRDGSNDNRSWNHGVEGPVAPGSVSAEIMPLRRRSIRNLMATLLLSTGTPMLTAGDEIGRTQQGNNNAYCQDNEISWIDWRLADWQRDLLATTRHLLRLRREHPALRPDRFFRGAPPAEGERPDLAWFDATGSALEHDAWHDPAVRVLQMLRSVPVDEPGPEGQDSPDGADGSEGSGGSDGSGGPTSATSDVLVVLNGALDPTPVVLADDRPAAWDLVWDSAWEEPGERTSIAVGNGPNGPNGLHALAGSTVVLESLSMRLYVAR